MKFSEFYRNADKTMLQQITAIIEVAPDGSYSASSDQVPGVYANGLTDTEVRTEFLTMMQEQAEYMTETGGQRPEWADAEVEFTYSISTLFAAFPFLNATALAEWMGINPAVMRRYKAGLARPRGKNREAIRRGLHNLSDHLAAVSV